MTLFGPDSAPKIAQNAGKCPVAGAHLPAKASHDCFIANCTALICEHALSVLVLFGFGVGLAHCVKNFQNSPALASSPANSEATKASTGAFE